MEENVNQNSEQTKMENTQTIENVQPSQNMTNQTVNTQTNGTVPPSQNTNPTSGNVPPNNNGPIIQTVYVERPRKPFPWKAVLKYAAIFLTAGACGFGGGILANHLDSKEEESVQEFEFNGNNMPQMPEFNNNNDNNSGNSSSGNTITQNTNSAALGIQVKETDDGVVIAGFSSDSNAESAGLKINDIIVAIDGNKYDTYNDIVSYIGEKSVGDVVSVTVERDGEEKTIDVELVAHTSNSSLPSSDNSSVY